MIGQMYGIVSASGIIGEAVVNRKNENLGHIHELVIDAEEGRLAYAVLSSAGFPWTSSIRRAQGIGQHWPGWH